MHASNRVSFAIGRLMAARCAALLLVVTTSAGCSTLPFGTSGAARLSAPIGLVAVLPVEPAADASPNNLAPDSERLVTAQLYGALADSSRWRFVPDLEIGDALPRVRLLAGQIERARALGREVQADTVLLGTVSRMIERDGSAYGAEAPASVAFRLQALSVQSGEIVWTGEFDETQQALSTNLFKFWQYWQGGPKWFSAAELTGLGVRRLLDDLHRRSD